MEWVGARGALRCRLAAAPQSIFVSEEMQSISCHRRLAGMLFGELLGEVFCYRLLDWGFFHAIDDYVYR